MLKAVYVAVVLTALGKALAWRASPHITCFAVAPVRVSSRAGGDKRKQKRLFQVLKVKL